MDPDKMPRLHLDRILRSVPHIAPAFLDTPLRVFPSLDQGLGCSAFLKIETENPIGCFKGRGTEWVVSDMVQTGDQSTLLCASAGNLGQALAFSAGRRGYAATVIASEHASPIKLERIQQLGAEVRLVEGDFESARKYACELAESDDHFFLLEDSLDVRTCEGAATIGLELADSESGPFDVVIIALGAGAMAAGVGFVMKQLAPATEVITVQPSGAPATTLSIRAKRAIHTETMNTIADGVAGRFTIPEVLDDLLEVVDDTLLVGEDSIKDGMRTLFHRTGLIVEPSAALGVAAILENPERFSGKRVASIICGRNIDLDDFHLLIS